MDPITSQPKKPRTEYNTTNESRTKSYKRSTSNSPKFPAPTLSNLPSTSDLSTDQQDYPDAACAAASLHPPNINLSMEPPTPSGHRRRRSSARGSYDAGKLGINLSLPRSSKRRSNTSTSGDQDGIHSQDDLSPSDDVLERMSEEDDEILDDEETGLTAADKGKRQGRRRRNTLLDERIAASEVKITAEEQKLADQSVFRQSLINGFLIALWYFFSLTISLVSMSVYFLKISANDISSITNGCLIKII